MNKQKIIPIIIALIILTINLSFGLPRLKNYSAVDEPYWTYDRTPKFWKAIKERRWKSTNINDKPGITVAIISGLGLPFIPDPMEYKSIRQEAKSEKIANDIKKINFSLRLPIYLTSVALLFVFFLMLKKLLNTQIALFALAFIALSPTILGISLIINPDSLLWSFLPLSLLSYLIYQKESRTKIMFNKNKDWYSLENINNKKYLLLCGFFLGLSLLTKYVANILYIFIFGLLFLEYIYNSKKDLRTYLEKSLLDYAIITILSMIVFFVFFPATWISPEMVLEGTIFSDAFKSTWPIFAGLILFILADLFLMKNRYLSLIMKYLSKYKDYFKKIIGRIVILEIIFVLFNVYSGMKIFDFEAIMSSPKGGEGFELMRFISQTSADFYTLFFAITPLVFIFFCYAIIINTFKKKMESSETFYVLYFSIFIILYYVASTINHVGATTRYQIVLFPLASIISAIGLYQFINIPKIKKYGNKYVIITLVIATSIFSLCTIKPFFFAYSSRLLPEKYVLNFKDMGDGSFEMAQKLNELPDAKNLTIWSDKGAVCETFLGKCKVGFNKNDVNGFDFSYYVVSLGRKSRSSKLSSAFEDQQEFLKLYSVEEPGFFRINLDGRTNNFVKIEKPDKKLN